MAKINRKSERKLTRVNAIRGAVALSAIGFAAPAFAESVSALEASYTGTNLPGVTIGNTGGGDPAAVISYIASQPGTLDGYTYTNWSMLANDGTGSLDLFGHLPAGTTEPTPTVGDAVSVTGTYSPFDGIPEIETMTALSNVSSGNAVPSPITVTIPEINATGTSNKIPNNGINEYLLTLNNVYIESGGVFPTHSNGTYTITDGVNTVTLFQWASSYSKAGMLAGTPIYQTPVDITGIADVFGTTAEFVPFSIVSVPEPASIGLLLIGGTMLLKRRAHKA